ncbi:BPL-N domain-containing protein [Rhizobium sp. BR 314]|uniref:BPL-N domain-containing protein n=1 Tax=Rhizobium sp. BR 314 TaxID=3040013 RepID=UPI0039BFD59C
MRHLRLLATIFISATSLLLGSQPSWSQQAEPDATKQRPLALIYRGPAGCDGCSETVAEVLKGSRYDFRIEYVGPKDKPINADTLSRATLYIQPGGGDDVEAAAKDIGQDSVAAVRSFVQKGGRYLGICMGAYLAGSPGFELIEGSPGSYVGRPGSLVKDDKDTVTPVIWRDKKRWVYYQDGNILPKKGATVLAVYPNHDIAAAVYSFGKGRVGLVGPHPEADQSWYDEFDLKDPDGLDTDLALDLLDTTMK